MHNAIEHSGSAEHDELGSSAEGDVPPERDHHPAPSDIRVLIDPGPLDETSAIALRTAAESALQHLPRSVTRVGLQVVDDTAMIALHRRWHDLDSTTDVLTFESDPEGPLDVDIAVCVDEARRQAATRDHDWQDELLLYVLHGLLHCCGHDDHTTEDQRRMYAAQDTLLRAMGRDGISGTPS